MDHSSSPVVRVALPKRVFRAVRSCVGLSARCLARNMVLNSSDSIIHVLANAATLDLIPIAQTRQALVRRSGLLTSELMRSENLSGTMFS